MAPGEIGRPLSDHLNNEKIVGPSSIYKSSQSLPYERKGGLMLKKLGRKSAPPGYRQIFCRYRRVKNSTKVLDAHDYGYEAWCFLVRGS